MTDALLHTLLDRGLALHPEYGGGLSSHLPMALQALGALGAGPSRLQAFAQRQAARLRPRHAAADELPGFEACVAELGARLGREGRDAVLRRELPALWPGAAAAAFHGLIRCAHAVAAGHDGELAVALAYWSARARLLPPAAQPVVGAAPPVAGAARPLMPLPDWLAALDRLAARGAPPGRRIASRLEAVAADPALAAVAGRLRLDEATGAGLARAAAARYAADGDFTVLHLVTASHAVGVLRPWTDDPAAALAAFSRAFAAAWLAADTPPAPPGADGAGGAQSAHGALEGEPPPWPAIVARAIASDDEHVIKLVHAARELQQAAGGEVFHRAAARAVFHRAAAGAVRHGTVAA